MEGSGEETQASRREMMRGWTSEEGSGDAEKQAGLRDVVGW